MKHSGKLLLIAAVALLTLGADLDRARFEKIGHELICTCGCTQILLECNHVGCPVSEGMRQQVATAVQNNGNDQAVMQSFVDQFGPTVLAAPPKTGFNRVAWVTPFAVFVLGLLAAIFFVRKWQASRLAAASSAGLADSTFDRYIEQARKETEL